MFNYILRRWVERRATKEEVERLAPSYLTGKQVVAILTTPQNDME